MKSMTPNNLGSIFLVEDCQKVSVTSMLKEYKKQIKEAMLRTQFEMLNKDVQIMTSKTGNNGVRFWFSCPCCKRRVGVLFTHPLQNVLGCRVCLGLEYRKRRYRGMVEENKFV